MKKCQTCGKENFEGAQYCDQCGTKLSAVNAVNPNEPELSAQFPASPVFSGVSVTSIGIPPIVEQLESEPLADVELPVKNGSRGVHAVLTIERGTTVGKEFLLSANESYLGRWDADNGVFPDVDLDAHDPEAKVSRRHARIIWQNGSYQLEDLGSTNGTYINRGRRLLPGTPLMLNDGDEIIIGKTFLRFKIVK